MTRRPEAPPEAVALALGIPVGPVLFPNSDSFGMIAERLQI
jgi:hypothetical protein